MFKISGTIGASKDDKGNQKLPRHGKLLSVLSNVLPEALEELVQSDLVAAVFPNRPLLMQQDYDSSGWDAILDPSSEWSTQNRATDFFSFTITAHGCDLKQI